MSSDKPYFPENNVPHFNLRLIATIFTRKALREQMLNEAKTPQIALVGRSNVGKSSLINVLAGRKRLAKTSSTPGKTISLNFYAALSDNFCLVDLPGYGYAKGSMKERQGWISLTNAYLDACSALKSLILLLDCRLAPQDSDQQMVLFAYERKIPLLPLLTKVDKVKRQDRVRRQKEWSILLDGKIPILFSSKDGTGLGELCRYIRSI